MAVIVAAVRLQRPAPAAMPPRAARALDLGALSKTTAELVHGAENHDSLSASAMAKLFSVAYGTPVWYGCCLSCP